MHCLVQYRVVILEEGIHPLLCFPNYNMFIIWWDLNCKHQDTATCSRGVKWKQKQRREEYAQRSKEVDFQAYGRPLVLVSYFKYLGRVLTAPDDNCPVVVGDLMKARKRWVRMSRIPGR